jgi:pre-mRNA-processing factor SLU7
MPPKGQTDPKKALPIIKDDYGNIVNPYIPRFIVKTPWYVADKVEEGKESAHKSPLEHQRIHTDDGPKESISDPVKFIVPSAAKKFKTGACGNCGAASHKTEDCVERPRAKGARITGKVTGLETEIKEEEIRTFESKRDRWRGYDPEEYMEVLRTREADLVKKQSEDDEQDSESEDEDGQTGTKQLRIREDTAKYLKDLKSSSTASYDPKTRSMREALGTDDGFVPGNAQLLREQVFAWNGGRETKSRDSNKADLGEIKVSIDDRKGEIWNDIKSDPKKQKDYRYNY